MKNLKTDAVTALYFSLFFGTPCIMSHCLVKHNNSAVQRIIADQVNCLPIEIDDCQVRKVAKFTWLRDQFIQVLKKESTDFLLSTTEIFQKQVKEQKQYETII